MKSQTLDHTIRGGAAQRRGIWLPSGGKAKRNWPLCMTCGRDVEAAEIKNANSKSCELWARCHGAEDYVRVTWDVPVRDASADVMEDKNVGWAIRRAMSDATFFDPHHIFNDKKL